jgi:hypothetical protein
LVRYQDSLDDLAESGSAHWRFPLTINTWLFIVSSSVVDISRELLGFNGSCPASSNSGDPIELCIQVEANRFSFAQPGTLHIFTPISSGSAPEEGGAWVSIGITIARHSSFSGVFL